jgi:hypothetical protein
MLEKAGLNKEQITPLTWKRSLNPNQKLSPRNETESIMLVS